jgi:hypothetical protein
VLEVNDICMVDVTDVIDGDPPIPIDGKGKVKDVDVDPFALNVGQGTIEGANGKPPTLNWWRR